MQTEAVAKQAASALATLLRWNQPIDDIINKRAEYSYPINEQLLEWINTFQNTLQSLGYISSEASLLVIGDAFANGELNQEDTICLLGFDDITPLYDRQLQRACTTLTSLSHADHIPSSLQRLSFDHTSDEMLAAAKWARTIMETVKEQQQPLPRIGIIVPNLGQCRKQVEFAFTAEFEAYSLLPDTERYTLPFNFSAGTPLADTPLIASTLQLLSLQEDWQQQAWDVECIVQCLLSPFWGRYDQELTRRCALASQLQSLGIFTVSGDTLRYWAQRIDERAKHREGSEESSEPGLFDYFQAMSLATHSAENHAIKENKASRLTSQQLPSAWVEVFLQQLEQLAWPGERVPDSQEYQQTQLWYQLLERFASLDAVMGSISRYTALKQLQQLASHTPFQAKVPDSPIQILGILEGASLDFTHCWVMGLHQQVWPPAPAPNTLLPIHLQREHNMPHASSLRELQYAQSLTNNYRHCADTIIFSSPNHEDDSEQHLLPSQLINDIAVNTSLQHSLQAALKQEQDKPVSTHTDTLADWQQQLKKNAKRQLQYCASGPAFHDTQLTGGASLLKAQADCPFDSFVKYRLGAQAPIAPMNGFSHIEKGNILHEALAGVWRELKDHNGLLSSMTNTAPSLHEQVKEHVDSAIRTIQKQKPHHIHKTLCQIESDRQCELIMQWLDYEKTRAPFTVVAVEEAYTVMLNGRECHIRIDRVDQLDNGQFLIIDYKTGDASVNAWKSERPKEPQLPLYALTYTTASKSRRSEHAASSETHDLKDHCVKGISFAQINVNAQTFKGLADANLASGIDHIEKNRSQLPHTWDGALEQWRRVLEQLLNEFTQGHCSIQYHDDMAKTYAHPYLRINRFYEADAIQRLLEQHASS